MKQLQRSTPFTLPIKFIQFGEGNFLRAYIDWQIELLNERSGLNAGVVIVQPRGHSGHNDKPTLDLQGGVYTTLIQGLDENGYAVKQYRTINCVQREINPVTMYADFLQLAHNPDTRFIVSNTTEAGISVNDSDGFDDTPPQSFPAKLTRLMYERFRHFNGAFNKGWVLLPCELIDHNGQALKSAVRHFAQLWQLGADFLQWLDKANTFCSTLVDRIVTGYPTQEIETIQAELGYQDQFLVAAEYYYVLVIEGPDWLADELKLANAGLNIKLVDNITPYKQAKVGILNGGHTTLVPVALLAGLKSVAEAVDDPATGHFLRNALAQEIIPALPLPRAEMQAFAEDVLRRFRNPFIYHRLESIALNSWPKFAARVMPQLRRHIELHRTFPRHLSIALAATFVLYRGDKIALHDDPSTLAWFKTLWSLIDLGNRSVAEMVQEWLANTALWGGDLNAIEGLTATITNTIEEIEKHGIDAVIRAIK